MPPGELRAPLLAWYLAHRRPLPWRVLWAAHGDPYHVWVSEIMLQQTVIKAVVPVYRRFLARFPDAAALAASSADDIRQAVRGLGYYRRFKMLHAAAKALTAAPDWRWPTSYEAWLALPGIGPYTAAAVSSIAFGAPAAVVDGNVERLFCRLLDRREPSNLPALKRAFQTLASELLDRDRPGDFNQAVMELGQTICTPAAPACDRCPLAAGCLARARGSQALAPAPKLKANAAAAVRLRLLITARRGRIAIIPRPAGARFLAGTAGFLTAVSAGGGPILDGWPAPAPRADWRGATQVGQVRHAITHHRIVADVEVGALTGPAPEGTRWLAEARVEEALVSNLDRKAWHAYLAMRGGLFPPGRAGPGAGTGDSPRPRPARTGAPIAPATP